MSKKPNGKLNRRDFGKAAAAATASVAFAAPAVVTAEKSGTSTVIGSGDYRYSVNHDWLQLPAPYHWQTTHDIAVDRDGLIYVIHEGKADLKDHPAIFVFDPDGKYVRSFGSQFQGGGHGLEVHSEDGEQFIYATAYQALKFISKLTLTGETVWQRRAPMESQLYADGEDTHPENQWGRDRFHPTNFAFHPQGDIYLADGYGSFRIHRYTKDGAWLSAFGEPGEAADQFQTPHGIWLDNRPQREPSLVIADRANGRVQWWTLAGEHIKTMGGFLLPANMDVYGELLLIPDLKARITLLNGQDEVVAQLGDDDAWREEVLQDEMKMRQQPERWKDGKFVHPHDACFDQDGNILVAEWVATGRVSKLTRLA